MLREYAFLWRSAFIALDLSISAGMFLVAYWLRFHPAVGQWFKEFSEQPDLEAYLEVLPALYLILFFTNSFFRLYHPRRVSSFLQEFVDLLKSNAMAILLLMTFLFFHRSYSYSRSVTAIFAVLNPMAVFLFRLSIRITLRWLRSRGYNLRTVLIVGTGRPAQGLLHRLNKNPWTGMRVAGFVALSRERVGHSIHGVPV